MGHTQDLKDELQMTNGNLFSIVGFMNAVSTPMIFLYGYFVLQDKEALEFGVFIVIVGFIMSTVGYYLKEPYKYLKPIGMFLNSSWLIMLVLFYWLV